MLVEQAVFASARTERGDGYQLVAVSPGVADEDRRALTTWCPSHDALLDDDPTAKSVNFHRLPSGAYSIARTSPAGAEFSGRGGAQVRTHCLITPPEVLARFGSNPFAVLRAALAGGKVVQGDQTPRHLRAFNLVGRARPASEKRLRDVCDTWGPDVLARFVHVATHASAVGLCAADASEPLIEAMLSCLPAECRAEFSFSTGLKYSPRRPFRVVGLADQHMAVRLQRSHGIEPVSLSDRDEAAPTDGWAALVHRLLQNDRGATLAAVLAQPRPGLKLADLASLAAQLSTRARVDDEPLTVAHAHQGRPRGETALQRAAGQLGAARPSRTLAEDCPQVVARLERLDDVVFAAIAGHSESLSELERLWPAVLAELGPELVEHSREQYLEFATRVWNESRDGLRDAQAGVGALDVLCILLD